MADLTHSQIHQFLHDQVPAEDLPSPAWGPIGEDVYLRSYSRNIIEDDGSIAKGWVWSLPSNRTTEVWAETVRRVVLGNKAYANETEVDQETIELFELIYSFKMVPAGRHLWMTGVPGAALKNCHRAGWSADIADHFRFLATQLFQGGGVGSNYSAKYRQRGQKLLGDIRSVIYIQSDHTDYAAVKEAAGELWWEEIGEPDENVEVIRVEDTREGWVEAWVRLISLAHESGVHSVLFDLSELRPFGAPLKSFGGRASGPTPLAASIKEITAILHGAAGNDRHISAIEAMMIDHQIASAIVAGGTRRSARMSQLNWDDPEVLAFIEHKRISSSVSWSTNISVVVDEAFFRAIDLGDELAHRVIDRIAEGMTVDGEPGIYNLALARVGERGDVAATNPCGEAILEEHYDPETGEGTASGESCNLGSIDLDAFGTDYTGARRAFELMGRFLYRATLAPVHDPWQREIEYRNRRIGVGIMGLQGWCAAHERRLTDLSTSGGLLSALAQFRRAAREAADELAYQLGLPRSIKVTAVAPTGTIAQLRGTTSGIHPVYARYFLRRIQYANSDPRLEDMRAKGYHAEPSVYATNTSVVAIPVKDIILDRHPEHLIEQADEISVDQFLALQSAVQTTFCYGNDGQAISATANIPSVGTDHTELAETLLKYLPTIKGATVFPADSRPQTPITAITRSEYLELLSEVDERVFGDSNSGDCVGGACPIR